MQNEKGKAQLNWTKNPGILEENFNKEMWKEVHFFLFNSRINWKEGQNSLKKC